MINRNPSLKLNMVMNAFLTMSSLLFPLITYPYITRVLQPEGVGIITFATSVLSYFSMFAQLGIPIYGIKICAQCRDDIAKLSRTVQELLIINITTCIIAYIALVVSIMLVPRIQEERSLFIVMSISIFLNAIGVEWLYKALEKYTYITVRSIAFKIIGIIAMLCFVKCQDDYIIYGGITIFAGAASNILNFCNLRNNIIIKPIGSYDLRRHIRPILVFFSLTVASTIYTNLDTVLLGFITTDAQVGYYGTAIKVKAILVSVITSISAVLLPRATYYIENKEKEAFDITINKTMEFTFLISIPIAIYFIIFAKESILLLAGRAFEAAILPMQIVMPAIIAIGITNIIGIQVLVPMDKEKKVIQSVCVGAGVDLIINILLINKIGCIGTAIATLSAEFAVLIFQIYISKKEDLQVFKYVQPFKIMSASIIACIACIWVKAFDLNVFITLIISAVLFYGAYTIMLLITKESLAVDLCGQLLKRLKR